MKVKMWLAVSRGGQYKLFDDKPARNEHFNIWEGAMSTAMQAFLMDMEGRGLLLPEMSWKDEPVEVEIDMSFVLRS